MTFGEIALTVAIMVVLLMAVLANEKHVRAKASAKKREQEATPQSRSNRPTADQELSEEQRITDLRLRLETSQNENQRLRTLGKTVLRERDALEARVKSLEAQLAKTAAADSSTEKFKQARAAFARLYHPDNIRSGGIEKLVRAEIFKEFWQVLDEIEKGEG